MELSGVKEFVFDIAIRVALLSFGAVGLLMITVRIQAEPPFSAWYLRRAVLIQVLFLVGLGAFLLAIGVSALAGWA